MAMNTHHVLRYFANTMPQLKRHRLLHRMPGIFDMKQRTPTYKRHVLSSCGVILGVGYVLYRLAKTRHWPTVEAKQEFDGANLPPSKRFNFIADVVEKTASSVVYIEILGRHPYTNQRIPLSNGSGFIVQSDGLILTNAHVVADRATVTVKMYDGKEYVGRVESVDLKADLATVRIPAKGLASLTLCRTKMVRPGEWVVALGSPLALSNTITAGVVSSVHRSGKELGMHKEMDYIQTDAAITFGNSGGPLVNLDGLVIGINTMKVTAGISFAIPADYALDFLEKRGQQESPVRWYLGITMLTLTPSLIQELQRRDPAFPSVSAGVLIWKVVLGSPAHLSGLSPGDVIVRVAGKDVLSSQDIYKALETRQPIQMDVMRRGEVIRIDVSPN